MKPHKIIRSASTVLMAHGYVMRAHYSCQHLSHHPVNPGQWDLAIADIDTAMSMLSSVRQSLADTAKNFRENAKATAVMP